MNPFHHTAHAIRGAMLNGNISEALALLAKAEAAICGADQTVVVPSVLTVNPVTRTKRGGRPKGSKNRPKDEPAQQEHQVERVEELAA